MRSLWAIVLMCATGVAEAASPVPADLYAEVDHALRPGVVLADPAAYRGRTLLLGGMVLRTVSDAAGVTIEVEGYRLDDDDRPESGDAAVGRVLAAGSGLDGAKPPRKRPRARRTAPLDTAVTHGGTLPGVIRGAAVRIRAGGTISVTTGIGISLNARLAQCTLAPGKYCEQGG
jgi:hypothetical protein